VRGRHALLAPASGNGGQKVFFSASDYAAYRDRLAEAAREAGVAVWA
jgi:putative transposase